ncbi:MAG: RloB family protein [Bacteroidota bacterium]|nr:RloB family protein [Bacteroidota bacterium]
MTNRKPKDLDKAWRMRQLTNKRELGRREIRNLFHIFCEGENTEPEYFKSFPINTETKITAIGLGRSKTALVEKAIDLLAKEGLMKRQANFDADRQLWVVFDYDFRGDFNEAGDFNNAIELAQKKGIQVAYSNDSFELWFVLHYQFQTSALTRNEYYHILSSKLNCNYEEEGKAKQFTQSLYQIFLLDQPQAIQNARRLHESKLLISYCDQNPCTTVYKLVEELNKCIRT